MRESCYAYAEIPANGRDQPLVFAFHGTGGDETQLVPLAQRVSRDATVIAPRGDVTEHGALRFFKRKGEGVYDFEDLELRQEAMTAFVNAQKDRLSPARTIGLGETEKSRPCVRSSSTPPAGPGRRRLRAVPAPG